MKFSISRRNLVFFQKNQYFYQIVRHYVTFRYILNPSEHSPLFHPKLRSDGNPAVHHTCPKVSAGCLNIKAAVRMGCSFIVFLASMRGFEPPTPRLGGACSIQLSYMDNEESPEIQAF